MRLLSLADISNMPPRVQGQTRMLRRMERRFPKLVAGMYNADKSRMRIVLRSLEQQTAEARASQIEDVRQQIGRERGIVEHSDVQGVDIQNIEVAVV